MKPQSSGAPESIAQPGELLRQAREARDWSLADVAAQLNLTRQRLEQLEAGEFDKLPGHTFTRGYLRAYAKLLGLDQQAIVAAFDAQIGHAEVASEVKSIGRINEPLRVSQAALRIVSLLILLVLGAVGFFWWQDRSASEGPSEFNQTQHIEVESADGTTELHPLTELEDEAVAQAQQSPEAPLALDEPATETPIAPAAESAPAQTETPAVAADASAPVVAPAPAAVPSAAVAATSETPVAPPVVALVEGEGRVAIRFSDTCWVQIKDANKRILHSSIKRAGESLEVTGRVPLEVHLGVAKAAAITFNGNQLDMSPYSSGETARIKLGQ